jgi:hypothetical protein
MLNISCALKRETWGKTDYQFTTPAKVCKVVCGKFSLICADIFIFWRGDNEKTRHQATLLHSPAALFAMLKY